MSPTSYQTAPPRVVVEEVGYPTGPSAHNAACPCSVAPPHPTLGWRSSPQRWPPSRPGWPSWSPASAPPRPATTPGAEPATDRTPHRPNRPPTERPADRRARRRNGPPGPLCVGGGGRLGRRRGGRARGGHRDRLPRRDRRRLSGQVVRLGQ